MGKIKAYELNLKGQFSNELTVEEVTVFTTKEEANKECETILARLNKKHNGTYKAKLI